MRPVVATALLCSALALGQSAEPTKEEIAQAYTSRIGEGGTAIPGIRWERWRVKQIRGWSLKFKRLHEDRGIGVLMRRYQAIAKKNGQCAEYDIVDTRVLPPPNPQMKIRSNIQVEPNGLKTCR